LKLSQTVRSITQNTQNKKIIFYTNIIFFNVTNNFIFRIRVLLIKDSILYDKKYSLTIY